LNPYEDDQFYCCLTMFSLNNFTNYRNYLRVHSIWSDRPERTR